MVFIKKIVKEEEDINIYVKRGLKVPFEDLIINASSSLKNVRLYNVEWETKDEETLKRDIDLSKKAGFHGARLHQKVFEKRFIYYWWNTHCNWFDYLFNC